MSKLEQVTTILKSNFRFTMAQEYYESVAKEILEVFEEKPKDVKIPYHGVINDIGKEKIDYDYINYLYKLFETFKKTTKLEMRMPTYDYSYLVKKKLLKEDDYKSYVDSGRRHLIEKKRVERIKQMERSVQRARDLSVQIRRLEANEALTERDVYEIEQEAKYDTIKYFFTSIQFLKLEEK